MSIFDNIERQREVETITCPFCNCSYIDQSEKRELNNCLACNGTGEGAQKIDQEVQNLFSDLYKFTNEEINKFISKLPSGFYRSELRTFLNMRKTQNI